jgi:hypothetical protein
MTDGPSSPSPQIAGPPKAPGSPGPARRQRAPGAYLPLKLWERYALAGVIAVALIVAMILFVERHNTNSPTSTNPAAQVQANRDAEILVAQDQAPRAAPLAARVAAATAIARVVHARMAQEIASGAISGPLGPAHCVATGTAGPRTGFTCRVVAGNVSYPFLGVVDIRTGTVTYCKRDAPPTPSDNVPVSARCRV